MDDMVVGAGVELVAEGLLAQLIFQLECFCVNATQPEWKVTLLVL